MCVIKLISLCIICSLVSCTTIDKQVYGWPTDIKVVKHELGFLDVQAKCWEHMPAVYKLLGGIAMACAEVNLYTKTCDIYHMKNPARADIEHELAHCYGGDHDGILQKYYDSWKVSGTL